MAEKIIDFAIELHRHLGPGLLESAYEECLCLELKEAGFALRRQMPLPVLHKDIRRDCGYRLDILVGNRVIIEVKSVECLMPIHEAQMLTCMKVSRVRAGLLLNCNTAVLKDGVRRLML